MSNANGNPPLAVHAIEVLIAAAEEARAQRDTFKAAYDEANELCTRLDRAVQALTGTPKAKRKRARMEGDTLHAPGQPKVSMSKQDEVLAALESLDHPAGAREIGELIGMKRPTVTSALAHLRHRGLIRFAGKIGTANTFTAWEDIRAEAEVTDTDA